MKVWAGKSIAVLATLLLVAAALDAMLSLWRHYRSDPWTRDARVRADIVEIAPDVSGLVSEVVVHDNDQVHRGDLLFRIDRQRFALALTQAEAVVRGQQSNVAQARRDLQRLQALHEQQNVSRQAVETAANALEQASAALTEAVASRDLARLNVERSDVRASVNGVVTNLSLNPGDYVEAGNAQLAVVDTDSLHVEGYFEETKLAQIQPGAAVSIRLMGATDVELRGHVDSIAAAIEDRERGTGDNLVANVNPTFSWVRLAQRIPVRISFDDKPADVRLVAGLTASVKVLAGP